MGNEKTNVVVLIGAGDLKQTDADMGIFIHGADKVGGGLKVLFFGLVFSVVPPPGNFSAVAHGC